MSEHSFEKMKKYYDSSDLPQRVTKSLKEGAVAEVQFENDPDSYMMIKENGKSVFKKGKPNKPQIYMKYSDAAIDYLIELQDSGKEDLEEYVSRFSECILFPTEDKWIKFKLCTNVVTGARMGYFGMMAVGGKKALDLTVKLGIKVPKRFMK